MALGTGTKCIGRSAMSPKGEQHMYTFQTVKSKHTPIPVCKRDILVNVALMCVCVCVHLLALNIEFVLFDVGDVLNDSHAEVIARRSCVRCVN